MDEEIKPFIINTQLSRTFRKIFSGQDDEPTPNVNPGSDEPNQNVHSTMDDTMATADHGVGELLQNVNPTMDEPMSTIDPGMGEPMSTVDPGMGEPLQSVNPTLDVPMPTVVPGKEERSLDVELGTIEPTPNVDPVMIQPEPEPTLKSKVDHFMPDDDLRCHVSASVSGEDIEQEYVKTPSDQPSSTSSEKHLVKARKKCKDNSNSTSNPSSDEDFVCTKSLRRTCKAISAEKAPNRDPKPRRSVKAITSDFRGQCWDDPDHDWDEILMGESSRVGCSPRATRSAKNKTPVARKSEGKKSKGRSSKRSTPRRKSLPIDPSYSSDAPLLKMEDVNVEDLNDLKTLNISSKGGSNINKENQEFMEVDEEEGVLIMPTSVNNSIVDPTNPEFGPDEIARIKQDHGIESDPSPSPDSKGNDHNPKQSKHRQHFTRNWLYAPEEKEILYGVRLN